MPHLRRLLLLLIAFPVLVMARGSLSGYCTQGGQKVFQNGQPSTTQVMQSYPQCLITVYNTGGPSGTVTTSGSAVTWVTGLPFNANGQWAGLPIAINGNPYTILSCSSQTSCTLTAPAVPAPTPVTYQMATTSPAAIYSSTGSTLANPFTASAQGFWQFYADNGQYDIRLSGGTIPAPFTWGAQSLVDPGSLPNTMSDLVCTTVGCVVTLCSTAASLQRTLLMSRMWDLNGTCAANIYAYTGGGFVPGSGHTTTLTGAFDGEPTLHFDISAGGAVNLTGATVNILPIQWFGARCNSSSNDAPATAAAITAAPDGANITFPRTGCVFASALTISKHLKLSSGTAGSTAQILAGADGFTMVTVSAGAFVKFEGLTFSANAHTGVRAVVTTNNSSNITFENVDFVGAFTYGVFSSGTLFQSFKDVRCFGGGTTACIALTSQSNSTTMLNVSVYPATQTTAITMQNSIGLSILGSTIECGAVINAFNSEALSIHSSYFESDAASCGGQLDEFVALGAPFGAAPFAGADISGNIFNGGAKAALQIGPAQGVMFYGNYVATDTAGVFLDASGSAALSHNNYIGPNAWNIASGGYDESKILIYTGGNPDTLASNLTSNQFSPMLFSWAMPCAQPSHVGSGDGSICWATLDSTNATQGSLHGRFNTNGTAGTTLPITDLEAIATGVTDSIKIDGNLLLSPQGTLPISVSGPQFISSCTNANPVVCTVLISPATGQHVAISGFTGGWTGANGIFTATRVSPTTFSVPVNSGGFGAVTGSPAVGGSDQAIMATRNAGGDGYFGNDDAVGTFSGTPYSVGIAVNSLQKIMLGGPAVGHGSTVVCWHADGKTIGYATVAEIGAGTCH